MKKGNIGAKYLFHEFKQILYRKQYSISKYNVSIKSFCLMGKKHIIQKMM